MDKKITQELRQKMLDLIQRLYQEPTSINFKTKPLRKSYPDYYKIIKYPMALSDIEVSYDSFPHYVIQKKLKTKTSYKTIRSFVKDLSQIWVNCQRYNQEGSKIYIYSVELQELSQKLLEEKGILSTAEDQDGEEEDQKDDEDEKREKEDQKQLNEQSKMKNNKKKQSKYEFDSDTDGESKIIVGKKTANVQKKIKRRIQPNPRKVKRVQGSNDQSQKRIIRTNSTNNQKSQADEIKQKKLDDSDDSDYDGELNYQNSKEVYTPPTNEEQHQEDTPGFIHQYQKQRMLMKNQQQQQSKETKKNFSKLQEYIEVKIKEKRAPLFDKPTAGTASKKVNRWINQKKRVGQESIESKPKTILDSRRNALLNGLTFSKRAQNMDPDFLREILEYSLQNYPALVNNRQDEYFLNLSKSTNEIWFDLNEKFKLNLRLQ